MAKAAVGLLILLAGWLGQSAGWQDRRHWVTAVSLIDLVLTLTQHMDIKRA
jgi:hypothetical protein